MYFQKYFDHLFTRSTKGVSLGYSYQPGGVGCKELSELQHQTVHDLSTHTGKWVFFEPEFDRLEAETTGSGTVFKKAAP